MRLLDYNSPWDADVVPFTFFFSREMTRSFAKGLVIPRLSLWGEMPFTKVCVTAPYELFIFYYHFATQTNIYIESLKEDEAREPKKAKKAKNQACE